MTAFQIYALYVSPIVLLVIGALTVWATRRRDRRDEHRAR